MPKITYADTIQPSFGIPFPTDKLGMDKGELFCKLSSEELAQLPDDEVRDLVALIEEQPEAAEDDPMGWGWTIESWRKVFELWKRAKSIIICGGNRCLTGDTLVLDAETGKKRRIDSIKGDHKVLSNVHGQTVIAGAKEPYRKGVMPVYHVELDNGESFSASGAHTILGSEGIWQSVAGTYPGYSFYHLESTSDTSRSEFPQDDLRLYQTVEDFLSGYQMGHHSCDEQLHEVLEIFQGVFQSLDDAPIHTYLYDSILRLLSPFFWRLPVGTLDDLDNIPLCIRSWLQHAPHAIQDDLSQLSDQIVDIVSRVSCKPCKSAYGLPLDQDSQQDILQSIAEFFLPRSKNEFVQRGIQYDYALACEYGKEEIDQKSRTITSIKQVGEEMVWDMEVPIAHNYWASGAFHHNSTKTSLAMKLIMNVMEIIDEAETYSLQTNEERSIKINQKMLNECLSRKLQDMSKRKGKNYSLDWSQKNGFSGDVCILPPKPGTKNGSACYFKNYSQYFNDPQAFEGIKGHLIHWDEEIPQKLFETLMARLGDYHGKMLGTVTTLQGYTPLITDLLQGAETLETRYAPLVGKELPTLQKAKNWPDTYIMYWWTEDNPFIDSQEIVRSYANRPIGDKLARLYGIPTKSHSNQFPKFTREVNVVKHEEIPFIKDPDTPVSHFMSTDPGDGKPWVIGYAGFTDDGDMYLYKESPDINSGEWAIPHQNALGQPIGKKGPAQRPLGWGFEQWKNHIEEMDEDVEVQMRWMDPNYCHQPVTKKEGQSTLLDEMAAVGMFFTPATYDKVGAGIIKINELLEWDDTEPLSETNRPRLYISDQCENTIQAMLEYTGVNKAEQWKDFVDMLRYIVISDSGYLGRDGSVEAYGGGGY